MFKAFLKNEVILSGVQQVVLSKIIFSENIFIRQLGKLSQKQNSVVLDWMLGQWLSEPK